MKLRLKEPGFETYTGQMGVINFVNGLSTNDVLQIDAIRVSGVMRCSWEDGSTSNVAQRLLDEADTPAQSVTNEVKSVETEESAESDTTESTEFKTASTSFYTEEDLAKIADEEGIAGLRAIADPLNIRGNSIRGLMDAIIKSKGVPQRTE